MHAQALENAELTARLAAVSAKEEPPTSAPSSARAVPMKAVPMEVVHPPMPPPPVPPVAAQAAQRSWLGQLEDAFTSPRQSARGTLYEVEGDEAKQQEVKRTPSGGMLGSLRRLASPRSSFGRRSSPRSGGASTSRSGAGALSARSTTSNGQPLSSRSYAHTPPPVIAGSGEPSRTLVESHSWLAQGVKMTGGSPAGGKTLAESSMMGRIGRAMSPRPRVNV